MFAGRGGEGREEVQVSVVGGGKESRTFFIDQQTLPSLSLSLLGGTGGGGRVCSTVLPPDRSNN